MLHRKTLVLTVIALIFFAPQPTAIVVAEDSPNESVYENINKQEQENNQNQLNENPGIQDEVQQNEETEVQGDALSITAWDFIKMIFALGFIIFLIYILLKFVTKKNRVFQQGQTIVNLGGTNLGQNKSVQMVKVGKHVLVVGVGESITLLKEIEDEQESKSIIEDFERKQETAIDSKDIFQKLASTIVQQSKGKKTISNPNTPVFSTKLNEQLQKIKEERTKQFNDIKRKGLKKNE
ncbi:flagellar biosynthetic protein FliO [Metabacillus halosaccharovorans]|uniref:Flagellar biosynthetic protein FliO n=1 Tax=Metabacillus halosaccharovorans TaxID=930124 RepID=A0ABT3DL95_9BACI|nr:flagellar biosynthetic protein FliO [Metabacillus halosaccharovorans]MCV9887671.1 flagellar biosynthetic protein FliO [Metabacillus halosaccharovorans]